MPLDLLLALWLSLHYINRVLICISTVTSVIRLAICWPSLRELSCPPAAFQVQFDLRYCYETHSLPSQIDVGEQPAGADSSHYKVNDETFSIQKGICLKTRNGPGSKPSPNLHACIKLNMFAALQALSKITKLLCSQQIQGSP